MTKAFHFIGAKTSKEKMVKAIPTSEGRSDGGQLVPLEVYQKMKRLP